MPPSQEHERVDLHGGDGDAAAFCTSLQGRLFRSTASPTSVPVGGIMASWHHGIMRACRYGRPVDDDRDCQRWEGGSGTRKGGRSVITNGHRSAWCGVPWADRPTTRPPRYRFILTYLPPAHHPDLSSIRTGTARTHARTHRRILPSPVSLLQWFPVPPIIQHLCLRHSSSPIARPGNVTRPQPTTTTQQRLQLSRPLACLLDAIPSTADLDDRHPASLGQPPAHSLSLQLPVPRSPASAVPGSGLPPGSSTST